MNTRITITIPAYLLELIKQQAKREHRKISQMIAHIVASHFDNSREEKVERNWKTLI